MAQRKTGCHPLAGLSWRRCGVGCGLAAVTRSTWPTRAGWWTPSRPGQSVGERSTLHARYTGGISGRVYHVPRGSGTLWTTSRDRDRDLNQPCERGMLGRRGDHQPAPITSLPFVHTTVRYYRTICWGPRIWLTSPLMRGGIQRRRRRVLWWAREDGRNQSLREEVKVVRRFENFSNSKYRILHPSYNYNF